MVESGLGSHCGLYTAKNPLSIISVNGGHIRFKAGLKFARNPAINPKQFVRPGDLMSS